MRLAEVKIEGFRSISGNQNLFLRPRLTCLIGANEHGKSNLLEAILRFQSRKFEENDRYSDLAINKKPIITYKFELSKEERGTLIKYFKEHISKEKEKLSKENEKSNKDLKLIEQLNKEIKWYDDLVKSFSEQKDFFTVTLYDTSKLKLNLEVFIWSDIGAKRLEDFIGLSFPEIRYFDPSEELVDSISLQELNSRKNLPFEGILKLGEVWNQRERLFESDLKADRLLNRAGKVITRKLRKIWTQGSRHTFKLVNNSGRLTLNIEDPHTFDLPSHRSLGFRSFLSFYLSLYAETEDFSPEGYILLMDEPGLHLHPQGQKDLLKELRYLSKRNQIVYTTHSPFLIDRNDLQSTILVKKEMTGKEKGTKLVYKPYGANWEPANHALGITPSDLFFLPDRSLIVEGTSDRMYVIRYMGLYASKNDVDLNYLSIFDADRRPEIKSVAEILLSLNREIVILSDLDSGGKDFNDWLRGIRKNKQDKCQIIDFRSLRDTSKPLSIEDLLPFDKWINAVQEYVSSILNKKHSIQLDELKLLTENDTLGRATAKYLFQEKLIERPSYFSKTTVADIFCRDELLEIPSENESLFKMCKEITNKLDL